MSKIETEGNTQELREDTLLQLLAVLIRRSGGEVVISQDEYEMMEGCPLICSHSAPNVLRINLYEEVYGDFDIAE